MNFKSILILQAAGLGDILFCQKIADCLSERYRVPIVWPVAKELFWLKQYIETNERVEFVLQEEINVSRYSFCKEPQIIDDVLVIPIRCADEKMGSVPIMQSKYVMCNLDFSNWQQHIRIKRNIEKEQQLLKQVVGDEEYYYINRLYATPPQHAVSPFINIDDFKHVNVVEHAMMDGYNVFDWLMIAEKAKQIHTVSTGNFYIFEALKSKLPPIHIYCRNHDANLKQLAFLKNNLNKHWIFHGDHQV